MEFWFYDEIHDVARFGEYGICSQNGRMVFIPIWIVCCERRVRAEGTTELYMVSF